MSLKSLSKELQDSIKSIVEKEKYEKYDIVVKKFDTRGNNFLGGLYEIYITGETTEGTKNINIFVKQQIPMETFKLLPIKDLYSNEVFFYKDLFKVFTTLQDEANVPQDERFRIAKAYEETNNNALILENLSQKGFRTYGKLEGISIKYAQLAIQQMAKFHALSFVIENKMPEYFNNKIKVLKNLFVFEEDFKGLTRNVCTYLATLYDTDVKNRIEKFYLKLVEKLPKYCNDQTTVRCTLIHSDYKKNNLLVRTQDGDAVEIVPVDYQFINYGCPLSDFFLFIFSSTDREFRKKHLNDLKELYFESLSNFLKYFDMDVEAVYPRKEFEKVYTEWFDFGLMVTLFYAYVIFVPDTGVDLGNVPVSEIPICPDKKFEYLYRGLIDDFIEWGYL